MIEDKVRDALFNEIHKSIEEATESVVSLVIFPDLSYPPGIKLTSDESLALSSLALSDAAKSGLRKLLSDACCYPLFHFLSLLDGVADPDIELEDMWCGVTISPRQEEDDDDSMWHDELFESYWRYKGEAK